MIIDEFNCRNLILFHYLSFLVTFPFWMANARAFVLPFPFPIVPFGYSGERPAFYAEFYLHSLCKRREYLLPIATNPYRKQSWNLGDFIQRIITIRINFTQMAMQSLSTSLSLSRSLFSAETMNHDNSNYIAVPMNNVIFVRRNATDEIEIKITNTVRK